MNKSRQALSSNNELALTLSVVRETLLTSASDMETLVTWLKLKIPKVRVFFESMNTLPCVHRCSLV